MSAWPFVLLGTTLVVGVSALSISHAQSQRDAVPIPVSPQISEVTETVPEGTQQQVLVPAEPQVVQPDMPDVITKESTTYTEQVESGPTAAEIALVQAQREYLNLQLLNSSARQATYQGQLDEKVYFKSIADSFNDSVRSSVLQGEIATLEARIATENATTNLINAQLDALPRY